MELRIPLSSPDIDEEDIAAVVRVLRTSRLSLGPMLARFEEEFADYIGSAHAVAVSSGTAGLHLALLAAGVGPGDEVIVPSFTFIAAANAIRYVGATPVFVDVDLVALNIQPEGVERAITPRSRALIVVHTFGIPAELDSLLKIAARNRLKVVEDACEAIGANYKNRRAGSFGDAGVFGFYPNKQMTTGEGGMVVTSSDELAATLRSLRNQGRRTTDDWFEHSDLGYNYRLSEMNCALGLSQLHRIESSLERREEIAREYGRHLRNSSTFILPPLSLPDRNISWFVYVLRLTANFSAAQRDFIRRYLIDRGIGCGRYFAPIHLQPVYRSISRGKTELPVTESEAQRTLAMPFFNQITSEQIGEICDTLREAVRLA